MNRRRFLQYTIALAVAAPLAKLAFAPTDRPLADIPLSVPPACWIPTQAEVDEWLEYYRTQVDTGCKQFSDVVRVAFTDEAGVVPLKEWVEAERAWNVLAADRSAVAWSQGSGYEAGRTGMPRENRTFTGPSNEGFGWYNYWEIGDRDRRGVRLPRSPGVSWSEGKRPWRNPFA